MALSPNYGWSEPDNSSLVKNGAQDIRTLGDAIDTSVWNIGLGQAGKNKFINGDMSIWQRGTSFSSIFAVYTADRYISGFGSGGTQTISRQEVTGATGLPSYIRYAMRFATTAAASGQYNVTQRIEDVNTLAGQTVTFSFYARRVSGSGTTLRLNAYQLFGSGGSTFTQPATDIDFTVTNSDFQRFSYTFTMPSMAGKTIGTDSYLDFRLAYPTAISTYDVTGWQLESGAKATPFQTASGGSDQGELAMCQRYYYRASANSNENYTYFAFGVASSTTNVKAIVQPKASLRTYPTAVEYGGTIILTTGDGNNFTVTSISVDAYSSQFPSFNFVVSSGLTAARPYNVRAEASSTAYIGYSAEL